ncbi:hypothetical protein HZA97_03245 [Candidatus Woesearchaeota archaeon]|nr:hypothetical protein [Candidatus Woesearchaeota archaeon]
MALTREDKNAAVIGIGVFTLFSIAVVGVAYWSDSDIRNQKKYDQVYNKTLITHADTNSDGKISAEEENAFLQDFYQGKNVTLIKNWPVRNDTGEKVSIDTVTEWLEKYQK